jgi:hypothetical protein
MKTRKIWQKTSRISCLYCQNRIARAISRWTHIRYGGHVCDATWRGGNTPAMGMQHILDGGGGVA